jgi:hypothetical protein
MKRVDLEQEFENRFQWNRDNRPAGAYYPAVVALAELENCLEALPKKAQAKWKKRINEEPLTEEIVREVERGLRIVIERTQRVVSVGERWCFEELALALGWKIEIEMVLLFLQKRQYLTEHDFPLDELDEAIKGIAKSKGNQRDFRMAVSLLRKNWGLPIRSKWLTDDLNYD